jgi:hypothetical protein
LFLTRAGSRPLHIHVEYPPASHLLKILSSSKRSIHTLFVGDTHDYTVGNTLESYPRNVQYDDVKNLNMGSLKKLTLQDLVTKEAEIFMDLALQSTCEEITLQLEDEDYIELSILKHDLMKRISGLVLSASESCSVLSEQLMNAT